MFDKDGDGTINTKVLYITKYFLLLAHLLLRTTVSLDTIVIIYTPRSQILLAYKKFVLFNLFCCNSAVKKPILV